MLLIVYGSLGIDALSLSLFFFRGGKTCVKVALTQMVQHERKLGEIFDTALDHAVPGVKVSQCFSSQVEIRTGAFDHAPLRGVVETLL